MKLIRLRLANYRGIDRSEVHFAPKGITIVEGPNEAGKTSLGEAIRLLFEYLDSSKHQSINAISPVHRDAGPEIELEAESGPYAFTYFKRFRKKSETTLKITSPKPENHTGREAHERAEKILSDTIDIDLWKALCIQQGEAIQQANLSSQTSLSAALDVVAGGNSADPKEESLFDKVHDEYLRYFTEKGKEKKELQDAQKAQEVTEAEVASLIARIQSLENDIVRAADLAQYLEHLQIQELDLRKDVSKYTKSLEEIKDLKTNLATARLKLESAQKTEEAAKLSRVTRQELIDSLDKIKNTHAKLDESTKSSNLPLQNAEQDVVLAKSELEKSEVQNKKAESLLKLRRADFDYFNNKLHLEQLKERKDRIDRAREETALAEQLLAGDILDEDALNTIQKAERGIITAQAKLEMGAPSVLLKGLVDLDFKIDDEQTKIAKDAKLTLSVSNRVRVTIPGALEMEVMAGASSSELSRKVETAKQKLETACKDVGVSNADEAMQTFNAQREAEHSIARQKEIEQDNLRDLTYDELASKVLGLGKSVPAYPTDRIPEPELPETLEAAKDELRNSEETVENNKRALDDARTKMDAAREVCDNLRERYNKAKVKYDLVSDELLRAENELERVRGIDSDEDLELEHSKYSEFVHTEEENVKSVDAALNEKEPERIKTLAETAKGSLLTVEKKRESAKTENTEVQTRLKISGEEGLHEKLNVAQSHLDHIQQENRAMIRRAAAAKLLYTTMKEERDKARRAYVAPLKEKIEKLGQLVFNKTFEVELTENLSIVSRTMDGANVPFDSLSGGTQEQISLISRLACAMIVSKNGGAPLILDDALGYTDPGRLKLMGAVLAKAGKECQIIILTCVPERYNNVGEAAVVRLG